MEIQNDVFVKESLEKPPDQQQANPWDNLPIPDSRLFPYSIQRPYGYIANPGIADIQFYQEVIGHSVTGVDLIERKGVQRSLRNCCIAAL